MEDRRLIVEVLSAAAVADRLRALDVTGLAMVADSTSPGPAALVVSGLEDPRADVVVNSSTQADALWTERIEPFARRFAGIDPPPRTPPVLEEHDPRLPVLARRLLDRLRDALGKRSRTYDHIGSTAVPGLRAKRFIDLQLGVPLLPDPDDEYTLAALGFRAETGARPDSPGVTHDWHTDPEVPEALYRKRLYVRHDPEAPAILHVRQLGNPWHRRTIDFRDRLRADPAVREAYETAKLRAAEAHAGDDDYDDYTRAKSEFFRSTG
ncbi:GrpB family protein [Saccharothrix sp. NRRL B-16348]|uniref:GrpB family protein n=1 Tax=Saccharothrix sp. NRRL B-16348 TaxID=1415542 RepID=UPI000AEEBFAE|nr:GrpB family protein [Saccharothrix sp. NRRL B-16348]